MDNTKRILNTITFNFKDSNNETIVHSLTNNLETPNINIGDDFYLNIYNIDKNNISSIENFIKKNYDEEKELCRKLLDTWIRINMNNNIMNIKEYNDTISNIYINILNINNEKDKKKIKKFIKKWLETKDINDFYFNLYNDIQLFLKKNKK